MKTDEKASVRLYFACVSPLCDDEIFSSAYENASEGRKAAADKFRYKSDKMLSLGAYHLLKHALSENGFSPAELLFCFGENGKPYIEGCPCHFNLSHSEEYALCAVSTVPVGCDIEKIRPDFGESIANRFFADEEKELLKSCHPDKKAELIYRLWTLKESYVKAFGKGITALPFNSFSVVRDGEIASCTKVAAGTTAEMFDKPVSDCVLTHWDCVPGYSCSAVTVSPEAEFEILPVDLKKIIL